MSALNTRNNNKSHTVNDIRLMHSLRKNRLEINLNQESKGKEIFEFNQIYERTGKKRHGKRRDELTNKLVTIQHTGFQWLTC